MKMRITLDVDVPSDMADQIQRSGFNIIKSGSQYRLKVCEKLVARDKAIVNIAEVPKHEE